MKYFLPFLAAVILSSCSADHHTNIVVDNKLKAVQFVHEADSFEVANGQYKVFTMLRNTGKQRLKNLQLNAVYLDENGKQLAQSIGGPETEIMPGDSAVVVTGWMFPTKDELPAKVILTASN